MTITHKPRITWIDGQWQCWTPAIFGGRVVGWGNTPEQAWKAHSAKVAG